MEIDDSACLDWHRIEISYIDVIFRGTSNWNCGNISLVSVGFHSRKSYFSWCTVRYRTNNPGIT